MAIPKGAVRIGKEKKSNFGDDGTYYQWFSLDGCREAWARARVGNFCEDASEIDGLDALKPADKEVVEKMIEDVLSARKKPKEPKKRKKKENKNGVNGPPSAKKKKTKKEEKTLKSEAVSHPEATDEEKDLDSAQKAAKALFKRAVDIGLPLADKMKGIIKCFGFVQANTREDDTFDLGKALQELATAMGKDNLIYEGGKKKWKHTAQFAGNQPLVSAFEELSSFYFKNSSAIKGVSANKCAKGLAEIECAIVEGDSKKYLSKQHKIAGFGKSSAKKLEEFLSTGKIEALEEMRNK